MKTCVLLSGLPRVVDKTYENIFNNLIKPNNADVFIHTWTDDIQLSKFILNTYKPKKYIFEPPKIFKNKNLDLNKMLSTIATSYKRDDFLTMIYSSCYSMHRCNLLKELYRLETDINYDYVVRARFDMIYNRELICAEYDPNLLYISNRNAVPGRGQLPFEMMDDRFSFGSNNIMNLYHNAFFMIDYIHNKKYDIDQIFCVETLIYEIVKELKIPCNVINDLVAIPIK